MKIELPFLLHAAGWGVYLVFNLYAVGLRQPPGFYLAYQVLHLAGSLVLFYTNYFYFIPQLLARERALRFFAFNGLVLAFLPVAGIELDAWLSRTWGGLSPVSPGLPYNQQVILRLLSLALLVGLAVTARFALDWFGNERQRKDLEKERLASELAFLKTQINPHFLFNTLNSLYALSIKGSPDTPDGILKLSQLMRYLLYESGRGRVYLVKELEAIGYYIHLQHLRMPAHLPIAYEVRGEVGDKLIEPMLLLPMVENVFKHGFSNIAIFLEVYEKQLVLRTRNSVRKVPVAGAGGIGLANLQRRLQLLYPGKHQLTLEEKEGVFHASLVLEL
jgi:hypothetical protein